MKQTNNVPVMRSRARLLEWKLNPRQGEYSGIEELVESIQRVGLQDPLHVWERPEWDLILKGHRRHQAMLEIGMTECLQVVHHFESEEEAYLYLLQDHGHTSALDASEKIVAAENALKLGIGAEATAAAMGVDEKRIQLWFAFGKMLPAAAKRALADGELSMNTAEHLLKVTKEQMAEAVAGVLRDEATGAAMSHSQAVAYIESKYLRPAQWLMDWRTLEAKLKKKLLVIEGHQYVEWEQRGDFVQGETGQPWAEYHFSDAYMPKNPGKTWGARAAELSATIYVVPAPRHEDKYVLLVSEKMIRAAESVQPELPRGEDAGTGGLGDGEMGRQSDEETGGLGDGEPRSCERSYEEEEKRGRFARVCLGGIWEALAESPAKVMTSAMWEPLLGYVAANALEQGRPTIEAWMGPMTAELLKGKMEGDTKQRAPMRWAAMLLICASGDESVMREIAESLGVDVGQNVQNQ